MGRGRPGRGWLTTAARGPTALCQGARPWRECHACGTARPTRAQSSWRACSCAPAPELRPQGPHTHELGAGCRAAEAGGWGATPQTLEIEENEEEWRSPGKKTIANPSIDGDSEARLTNPTRPDEALDETNAVVPTDSTNDARIGSNCSPELSLELESLRTLASNSGS
jgi:hypothetical protein